MSEAKLEESDLADVGAQPTSVIEIVAVDVIFQTIHNKLKVFLGEHHFVHGQEGSTGGFRQLDEVLPRVGIVVVFPKHTADLITDVAWETTHAVAFNEGGHVIFEVVQIVRTHRKNLPAASYQLSAKTRVSIWLRCVSREI